MSDQSETPVATQPFHNRFLLGSEPSVTPLPHTWPQDPPLSRQLATLASVVRASRPGQLGHASVHFPIPVASGVRKRPGC
jgi:hypothetical protein